MQSLEKIFKPLLEWISYYTQSLIYWIQWKTIWVWVVMFIAETMWWFDRMIMSALTIYFLDFVIWILIALHKKIFDLDRFAQWMAKLWMFVVLISAWNHWDHIIWDLIWYDGERIKILSIRSWCILYFGIHELISLLKKLSQYEWFPIPRWLTAKLITYKEKLDEGDIHSPNHKI
jgi:Bacteriophage holin family